MPRLVHSVPKYSKHRASGQAVVTIAGVDHYLGPHGTKASHLEYDRLILEWLAAGRPTGPVSNGVPNELTVAELINAYRKHAAEYYRWDGESTGTEERMRPMLRTVKELYGREAVSAFRPLSLEALQAKWQEMGHSRQYINMNTARLKRMFRWGVSKELVPVEVIQRLQTVRGLSKGRTSARESPPVLPVADSDVELTLPYLPPVIRDMVQFERLTGARPSEVCKVRPCDVDRSGDVWLYRPESHKTQHHGHKRVIFIGPKAQEILRPYLLRGAEEYCFSPRDAERRRQEERHAARRTPLSCGNVPGSNRKPNPKRQKGERYNKDSYHRAVHRTIEIANRKRGEQGQAAIPFWSPARLRHTAATEIRARFGLEAAQVALGHSRADVTQVYAERDETKGIEVARAIG